MEIEQKERERELEELRDKALTMAFKINQDTATISKLEAEINAYKSVMIAAAEEIQRCWPAHCDAEGYGPSNLMHRLEKGIPSQYEYTAGAFAKLESEIKALREALETLRAWLDPDVAESENKTFLDDIAMVDQLLKNEG